MLCHNPKSNHASLLVFGVLCTPISFKEELQVNKVTFFYLALKCIENILYLVLMASVINNLTCID